MLRPSINGISAGLFLSILASVAGHFQYYGSRLARQSAPAIVDNTTIFPGERGCRDSTYNKCILGGDALQDPCIALSDGSHICSCSTGYQIYSDGICKPYPDPCDSPFGLKGADACQLFGDIVGTCVANSVYPNGYGCDCPTGYLGLYQFTGCYSDPCATDPCNGGTCTAQNGDASTWGYPYTCSNCPAGTTYFDGNCYDPCADSTCSLGCTVDTTRRNGYSCACDSTQAFDGSICVDPCTGGGDLSGATDCPSAGDAAATCSPDETSPALYYCSCTAGFTQEYNISTQKFSCVDVDECASSSSPCGADPNAVCTNGAGSHTCACSEGFIAASPTECIDIDECTQSPCGANTECTNVPGSYECTCRAGFELVGADCVDIDECAGSPCDPSAVCTNIPGSYECTCPAGFKLVEADCIDVDECAASPCGSNAVCTNVPGSYECTCRAGFKLVGADCVDINECNASPCAANAVCENLIGSFRCKCLPGFKSIYGVCLDINECWLNPCGKSGKCVNTPGSYTCTCSLGQYFTGKVCLGDDKCPTDACGPNSLCERKKGVNICRCVAGFTRLNGVCTDVNECLMAKRPCQDRKAVCINTPGSYQCQCPAGTAYLKGKCKSAPPCVIADVTDGNPCNNGGDKKGKCFSDKKKHTCKCSQGFKFRDGQTCKKRGNGSSEEDSSSNSSEL